MYVGGSNGNQEASCLWNFLPYSLTFLWDFRFLRKKELGVGRKSPFFLALNHPSPRMEVTLIVHRVTPRRVKLSDQQDGENIE